jgi:DNA-binding response OmpR family regulator
VPEVLLVDDNLTQLRIREAVLTGAGLSVVSADTAERALELLLDPEIAGSLGVIVTDHLMPAASGAALVRGLRGTRSSIAVIVISGLADAKDEYTGLNVSFLHKPCPPEELITRVREALKGSKPL